MTAKPRTLAQLAAHPWVESVSDERSSGQGIWVYTRPGFVNDAGGQTIHEATVKGCLAAFADTRECSEGVPAADSRPVSRTMHPLAQVVLIHLQAANGQWTMVEATPIVDLLKDFGWLQRSDVRGSIGPDRIPAVECRITPAGLAALAARPIA